VRRAGVENSRRRVGKPACNFLCGFIRKTKENNRSVAQSSLAGSGIFAQIFRKRYDFQIMTPGKPIANPERRRSGLAVDIDFRWHAEKPSLQKEFYAELARLAKVTQVDVSMQSIYSERQQLRATEVVTDVRAKIRALLLDRREATDERDARLLRAVQRAAR